MLSEIDHTRMLGWHCSENYGYKSFAMDENCRCNSSLGLVGEAGVYLGAAIFITMSLRVLSSAPGAT